MRISLLCALLAVPAAAADFTLETVSGEASRDASHSKAIYVVSGTKVTMTTESRGRNFRPDDGKPDAPKTATISNPKELDAALEAIRATKDDKKTPKPIDTRYSTGCLIEGKVKRCSTVNDGTSPRLDAIGKLEELLLMEVMK